MCSGGIFQDDGSWETKREGATRASAAVETHAQAWSATPTPQPRLWRARSKGQLRLPLTELGWVMMPMSFRLFCLATKSQAPPVRWRQVWCCSMILRLRP